MELDSDYEIPGAEAQAWNIPLHVRSAWMWMQLFTSFAKAKEIDKSPIKHLLRRSVYQSLNIITVTITGCFCSLNPAMR